jgi:hypothetical protein
MFAGIRQFADYIADAWVLLGVLHLLVYKFLWLKNQAHGTVLSEIVPDPVD